MGKYYRTFLEEEDDANKKNIKSCPFCGGKALVAYGLSGYAIFQVYCTECGAMSVSQDVAEDAIVCWEKRVTRRRKSY